MYEAKQTGASLPSVLYPAHHIFFPKRRFPSSVIDPLPSPSTLPPLHRAPLALPEADPRPAGAPRAPTASASAAAATGPGRETGRESQRGRFPHRPRALPRPTALPGTPRPRRDTTPAARLAAATGAAQARRSLPAPWGPPASVRVGVCEARARPRARRGHSRRELSGGTARQPPGARRAAGPGPGSGSGSAGFCLGPASPPSLPPSLRAPRPL